MPRDSCLIQTVVGNRATIMAYRPSRHARWLDDLVARDGERRRGELLGLKGHERPVRHQLVHPLRHLVAKITVLAHFR
jgi:hypothetical protein